MIQWLLTQSILHIFIPLFFYLQWHHIKGEQPIPVDLEPVENLTLSVEEELYLDVLGDLRNFFEGVAQKNLMARGLKLSL